MRIGLSSLIGEGFGSGSFTFGEVAGGFLPYGTFIQTLNNQTYPISEGGSYFDSPVDGTTDIPNQSATVDELANGTGGVFLSNWRDIFFKTAGTNFAVDTVFQDYTLGSTVTINGDSYYTQRAKTAYQHDGTGSYSTGWANIEYYPSGTVIATYPYATEVPSGSGNYYTNGLVQRFFHNGSGSSYVSTISDYSSYGTFILNDGTNDYWWDGNGGYYYT